MDKKLMYCLLTVYQGTQCILTSPVQTTGYPAQQSEAG